VTSANTYRTLGVDNSWNEERWKKEFKVCLGQYTRQPLRQSVSTRRGQIYNFDATVADAKVSHASSVVGAVNATSFPPPSPRLSICWQSKAGMGCQMETAVTPPPHLVLTPNPTPQEVPLGKHLPVTGCCLLGPHDAEVLRFFRWW